MHLMIVSGEGGLLHPLQPARAKTVDAAQPIRHSAGTRDQGAKISDIGHLVGADMRGLTINRAARIIENREGGTFGRGMAMTLCHCVSASPPCQRMASSRLRARPSFKNRCSPRQSRSALCPRAIECAIHAHLPALRDGYRRACRPSHATADPCRARSIESSNRVDPPGGALHAWAYCHQAG